MLKFSIILFAALSMTCGAKAETGPYPKTAKEIAADPYACFGSGRYAAMSDGRVCTPKPKWTWLGYTCDDARAFMASHTSDEAQTFVKDHHIPNWVINRAKRLCNLE